MASFSAPYQPSFMEFRLMVAERHTMTGGYSPAPAPGGATGPPAAASPPGQWTDGLEDTDPDLRASSPHGARTALGSRQATVTGFVWERHRVVAQTLSRKRPATLTGEEMVVVFPQLVRALI